MSRRITVVIPTRERCETLVWALKTCVSQDYEDLEIIVSDNASTDSTREVVAAAKDGRIRYVNPGTRLSMSEHWDFALSHVQEGMVLFLGDDDGLMPGAISELGSLTAGEAIPLIWPVQQYFWPNFANPSLADSLIMPLSQPRVRQRVDTRSAVNDVLAGRRLYSSLPSPYFGLVPTQLLDRVRTRSGGIVFRSITPDIYGGFAVAAVCDSYHVTDHAYSIAGQSAKSNGASQLSGGASDAGSEAARFEQENTIAFHSAVAHAPSIPILVAEAFLQARDHLGLEGDLDLERVLRCALRDPGYVANRAVRPAVESAVVQTAATLEIEDRVRLMLRKERLLRPVRTANQVVRSLLGGYPLVELRGHQVENVFEASLIIPAILEEQTRDRSRPMQRLSTRAAKARRIVAAMRVARGRSR